MYCSNCGNKVKNSSEYCSECGEKVEKKDVNNDLKHVINGTKRGFKNKNSQEDSAQERSTKTSVLYHYKNVWKKAGDLEGRASRAEYWSFTLINLALTVLIQIFVSLEINSTAGGVGLLVIIAVLYLFISIVPGFTVSVRRLHDIGKSGWTLLWSIAPLIGPIILLVYYARPSQSSSNKYGWAPQY